MNRAQVVLLSQAVEDEPHRIGSACPCWRCVAHRAVLEYALRQTCENEAFKAQLDAVRRRTTLLQLVLGGRLDDADDHVA